MAPSDRTRAQFVANHYLNVLSLLHAHHEGEDHGHRDRASRQDNFASRLKYKLLAGLMDDAWVDENLKSRRK